MNVNNVVRSLFILLFFRGMKRLTFMKEPYVCKQCD